MEDVDTLVDDGVNLGLLKVSFPSQTSLPGQEAGDGHGLADDLAIPGEHGQRLEWEGWKCSSTGRWKQYSFLYKTILIFMMSLVQHQNYEYMIKL